MQLPGIKGIGKLEHHFVRDIDFSRVFWQLSFPLARHVAPARGFSKQLEPPNQNESKHEAFWFALSGVTAILTVETHINTVADFTQVGDGKLSRRFSINLIRCSCSEIFWTICEFFHCFNSDK